jgi:hypothetical protein
MTTTVAPPPVQALPAPDTSPTRRRAAAAVVALHGVAHLAGLSADPGRAWLWAAIGAAFAVVAVLLWRDAVRPRRTLALAAAASLVLTALNLPAAAGGLAVDVAILAALARRTLGHDLRATLAQDVRAARLPAPAPPAFVTEASVADLPPVVRRYLGFMGVVGQPRVMAFTARFRGRFRLRPGQAFMRCAAWQHNAATPPSRLFDMRVDLAGLVPMVGRDSYVRGKGRMHGRLLGLVTVADGTGPELDLGELVTYLNDAVLLAPSMLLGPSTTWTAVDDDSFDVALTDGGLTVTARVTLDERGAPVGFSTTDRYAALGGRLVRTRWSTPVEGWTVVDGHPLPTRGRAVWNLPDGDFVYAEGAWDAVTYA